MKNLNEQILKILQDINNDIPDDIEVNLLEKGIIDSFDMANIVSALEENFNIEIDGEDIIPENFDSIINISKIVDITDYDGIDALKSKLVNHNKYW